MWLLSLVEVVQPMNLLSIWKIFSSQEAQPSISAALGAGGQHIGAERPATLLPSIRIHSELTHLLPWSSCQPGCFQPRSVNVYLPQCSCQSFTPTPSWRGFVCSIGLAVLQRGWDCLLQPAKPRTMVLFCASVPFIFHGLSNNLPPKEMKGYIPRLLCLDTSRKMIWSVVKSCGLGNCTAYFIFPAGQIK